MIKSKYKLSLDKYSPDGERLYVSFFRLEKITNKRSRKFVKKTFFAAGFFNFVKECFYVTTWWRGSDDDLNGMFKILQERDWTDRIVYENDCEILTKFNSENFAE